MLIIIKDQLNTNVFFINFATNNIGFYLQDTQKSTSKQIKVLCLASHPYFKGSEIGFSSSSETIRCTISSQVEVDIQDRKKLS